MNYRVSHKTLYAFYFAITQLLMHRGFSSWTFSNSPFRWLFEIVKNFKDRPIFGLVIKEILTEGQNKIQQKLKSMEALCLKLTNSFHKL